MVKNLLLPNKSFQQLNSTWLLVEKLMKLLNWLKRLYKMSKTRDLPCTLNSLPKRLILKPSLTKSTPIWPTKELIWKPPTLKFLVLKESLINSLLLSQILRLKSKTSTKEKFWLTKLVKTIKTLMLQENSETKTHLKPSEQLFLSSRPSKPVEIHSFKSQRRKLNVL